MKKTSWWDQDSSYFDEQEAIVDVRQIWAIRAGAGNESDPGPPPPDGWPPEISVEDLEKYSAQLNGLDAAQDSQEGVGPDRLETGRTPDQLTEPPPLRQPSQ